ncbi:MAG: hypothetical protein ABSA97_11045 [Verrucomicrobiia bacterium]
MAFAWFHEADFHGFNRDRPVLYCFTQRRKIAENCRATVPARRNLGEGGPVAVVPAAVPL